MKSINTMKFITEYSKQMSVTLDEIVKSETYDEAKKIADYAFGFLDGMVLFTNTMVCAENNDFTAEMSDVEDRWCEDIYKAVVDVAIRTRQPYDEIKRMIDRRDEFKR